MLVHRCTGLLSMLERVWNWNNIDSLCRSRCYNCICLPIDLLVTFIYDESVLLLHQGSARIYANENRYGHRIAFVDFPFVQLMRLLTFDWIKGKRLQWVVCVLRSTSTNVYWIYVPLINWLWNFTTFHSISIPIPSHILFQFQLMWFCRQCSNLRLWQRLAMV